jgi:hypothetical protein
MTLNKDLREFFALLNSTGIRFVGDDALFANKRASARPQDLADISMLENPSTPS